MVKPSASRAVDSGFESRSRRGHYSGPRHSRDLNLGLSSGCPARHRFAGFVVKASAPGVEDPGFESRLRRDFSGSSRTSDLKIDTPVATLPSAWLYGVSAGTGLPGISML